MSVALKKHLELLHGDSDSFITVGQKGDKGFCYHYHFKGLEDTYNAIMDLLENNKDTYVSNAGFFAPKRGIATLRRINTLFADFDCHEDDINKNSRIDSLLYYLKKDYFGIKVPYPTTIVFTGRGIQAFWIIEHAPRQALPLWTLVQNKILEELDSISEFVDGFRVDWGCKDVTRISRVPGSWNTKANIKSEPIEVTGEIYRLDDIVTGYFPELDFDRDKYTKSDNKASTKPKKRKTQFVKSQDGKEYRMFNTLKLLQTRATDLEKLIKLRGGDCKGYRDHLLFFYVWTVINKHSTLEDVERELNALNCLFKAPMSDDKIKKKAKHVYNKFNAQSLKKDKPMQRYEWYDRYVFRNETVIKKLNITLEEQRQLDTIISKEIKAERDNERKKKARRNENGLTKREQDKADKIATVKELKRLGYNNTKISQMLGISRVYVSKILNDRV